MWRILMWNQSCVKERDRQREKDVRGQVISRFFFNIAGKATAISLH